MCIADIKSWMIENKLRLNDEKTEFLLVGTPQQLKKVNITSVDIGDSTISLSQDVRILGLKFDCKLSMKSHVKSVCQTSLNQLRDISMIRRYLTKEAAIISVNSFVTSRLDCCNALLYGIPAYLMQQLQVVQNATAKVVAKRRKFDHMTPILKDDLHWGP